MTIMIRCIVSIIKEKKMKKFKDVWAYFTGWYRFALMYRFNGKFLFLMRPLIKEQIEARLLSMRTTCFIEGSCVKCGCVTPALQMAHKSCDDMCYPELVSKETWKAFKAGEIIVRNEIKWKLSETNEFEKV